MRLLQVPRFVRAGEPFVVRILPSKDGRARKLVLSGAEQCGHWLVRRERNIFRKELDVRSPSALEPALSVPLTIPEDAPASCVESQHAVVYRVILETAGGAPEFAPVVVAPHPGHPSTPVSADSAPFSPERRPCLSARVQRRLLWPGCAVNLQYRLSEMDHHIVRRLGATWSFDSHHVSRPSRLVFGPEAIELAHAEAHAGIGYTTAPSFPVESLLPHLQPDGPAWIPAHHRPNAPAIPVWLRVAADVAWGVDVEVWLAFLLANPEHQHNAILAGWVTACDAEHVDFFDLELAKHFDVVRCVGRLEGMGPGAQVVFRYEFPSLEAGFGGSMSAGDSGLKAAKRDYADLARGRLAPLLADGTLELSDSRATFALPIDNPMQLERSPRAGIELGRSLDALYQEVSPPPPLRGGLRLSWLALARVLGGELDEDECTIRGNIGGLPAVAKVPDSASGAERALLRIDLPFRIDDPEEFKRRAPSLITARVHVSDSVVAVIFDMHLSLPALDGRLRSLVQAVRQLAAGPFR